MRPEHHPPIDTPVSEIDKLARRENENTERALQLLEMITEGDAVEDPSNFTWDELNSGANALDGETAPGRNYTKKDLQLLVNMELVQELDEQGHYGVAPDRDPSVISPSE